MEPRVVSAPRLLTPLAVLVPILATLIGTFWALTVLPPLALLVIAGGLTVVAFAGRPTYGARTSLVTAAITLLAAPLTFFLWWALSINTSIYGKNTTNGWTVVACAIGALVFFALGSFGFRTRRAAASVPMALVAGVLATLQVFAVAPGTPGFCET